MSPKLASKKVFLTESELAQLEELYNNLGAWTLAEAVATLGVQRVADFSHLEILGQQDTEMGPMLHLLAAGRQAVLGKAGEARSLASQLDRAYLRLSLAQLGWDLTDADHPFSRHLTDYVGKNNLFEAFKPGGTFLVGGKLTDGGYSPAAIRQLGEKLKSQALYHRFDVILIMPSPRRGQLTAKKFSSFLTLQYALPANGTSDHRFKLISRVDRPVEDGPVITSAMAHQLRGETPALSLAILQHSHRDRVELARAALDCDGVMTGQQLEQHYGLQVSDLPGTLSTTTILRPQAKADATEVATQLMIASKRMCRLSDARLLHLINLAELRHNAGIIADPKRWSLTRKSQQTYEEPDAIYTSDSGEEIAAESDVGFYTSGRIADKLATFQDRGFAGILYGTPSSKRCQKLREQFAKIEGLRVVQTRWWLSRKT